MSGSGMSTASLQPTWLGHVVTARDALMLFEACLNGTLHHVPRRPHDRERSQLIRSGCVFIYEENASGIKRWTDGVPWSPSRILGNFLVYRELVKPFAPGEKKRATRKNRRPPRPEEPYPNVSNGESSSSAANPPNQDSLGEARERERALIGSLVDSYHFKEGGLVKKTMSVNVHGVYHHLVSYYRIDDAIDGTLQPPTADSRLANVEPRPDLLLRQNWRIPVDENEDIFPDLNTPQGQNGYGYPGQYGRPGMMGPQSPTHGSQQSPLQMGHGSLPPAGHSLPPAIPGHETSSMVHSPNYYQGHGAPSPARPHGYDYQSYISQPPHSDRPAPYSQPPQNYPYRQSSGPGPMSPTGPPRNQQPSEWSSRSASDHDPMYSGGQQPHPSIGASPYPPGNNAWPMSPHEGINLPPPEGGWNYNGGGSNSYGGGPPPYNGGPNTYSGPPPGGQ